MTVWNTSDQRNITVTGSGLIATVNTTNGANTNGIRADTSKSGSGKYVIEFTVNNQNDGFYGLEYAGKDPYYNTGPGIWQLHYYSGATLFEEANGPWLFFDNTTLPGGGYPPFGTPYTLRFFVDLDNNRYYVQINGTNMGGCDPTAQTGGFGFTPSGPLFPFFGGVYSGESATLNPTPTSLPAGWTAWDASTGATLTASALTNTAPVLGPATLTINAAPLTLYDYALDYGLNAFLLANKIVVCSALPTTYTEANSTFKIGQKSFSIGGVVTSGPQAASPDGRQIVTAAVVGGSVTTNGTPTNWAIVDDANTRLLAAGIMTGSVAVTTADGWTLDAMTINVP